MSQLVTILDVNISVFSAVIILIYLIISSYGKLLNKIYNDYRRLIEFVSKVSEEFLKEAAARRK